MCVCELMSHVHRCQWVLETVSDPLKLEFQVIVSWLTCVCVRVGVPAWVQCLQRPEESIEFPGAGVAGDGMLPDVDTRN